MDKNVAFVSIEEAIVRTCSMTRQKHLIKTVAEFEIKEICD